MDRCGAGCPDQLESLSYVFCRAIRRSLIRRVAQRTPIRRMPFLLLECPLASGHRSQANRCDRTLLHRLCLSSLLICIKNRYTVSLFAVRSIVSATRFLSELLMPQALPRRHIEALLKSRSHLRRAGDLIDMSSCRALTAVLSKEFTRHRLDRFSTRPHRFDELPRPGRPKLISPDPGAEKEIIGDPPLLGLPFGDEPLASTISCLPTLRWSGDAACCDR